jgi:DNA-binding NarL/FixJ family response regulator
MPDTENITENSMQSIKKDEKVTNVLIIDNDKSTITDLQEWIKKSEIESKYQLSFIYAKNAAEAMKKLDEMEINLVVLEIALPMISGYYLINAIRKEHKDLTVIIYTKLKNPQDLAKMASSNVDNIFLKELMSIQDLVEIIRKKETVGNIDQIVIELNSQIKALHGAEAKQELKLIQCPNCHLIIAPDSHFCNNCGQKIFKKPIKILKKAPNETKDKENETENTDTGEEAGDKLADKTEQPEQNLPVDNQVPENKPPEIKENETSPVNNSAPTSENTETEKTEPSEKPMTENMEEIPAAKNTPAEIKQ